MRLNTNKIIVLLETLLVELMFNKTIQQIRFPSNFMSLLNNK